MKRLVLVAVLAVFGCQTGRNCDCDAPCEVTCDGAGCSLQSCPTGGHPDWTPTHPADGSSYDDTAPGDIPSTDPPATLPEPSTDVPAPEDAADPFGE